MALSDRRVADLPRPEPAFEFQDTPPEDDSWLPCDERDATGRGEGRASGPAEA